MTCAFLEAVRGSAARCSGERESFAMTSLPNRLRVGIKGSPIAPAVKRETIAKLL